MSKNPFGLTLIQTHQKALTILFYKIVGLSSSDETSY